MDKYAATGTINVVTPTPGDSALVILASTLTRAKIHFFVLAASGTPADNVLQWLIRRLTADGTGTAVTPLLLDPGAPAAQLSARQNYTAEPTYAATSLLDLPVHQRIAYQWNAAPGGEIIIPAVAGGGIGFTPIHAAYAGAAVVTAHWME